MKLSFINEDIFEPHKILVEREESSYRYIDIYIYILHILEMYSLKKCKLIPYII